MNRIDPRSGGSMLFKENEENISRCDAGTKSV